MEDKNLSQENVKKHLTNRVKNLSELEQIEKTNFFEHYSANVVSFQNGNKLFPTINGEIINYKLGIWAFRDKKIDNGKAIQTNATTAKDSIVIHYLPFSIISKVSADYMDPAAGTLNDATSFFGAPLTFRIAPGVDLTKNWSYNKIFAGF
jgi:hypothetical protein